MKRTVAEPLLSRLRGNSFARGAAVLGSGTALGQLILVAFSPVLSRLYTPEAYGVYGLYQTFVGIATP